MDLMNSQNVASVKDVDPKWTICSNKNRTMKNDSISNLTIQMLTNSTFFPEKPPGSLIQALTSNTLMYEETPYTLENISGLLETFEPSQMAYIGMKR